MISPQSRSSFPKRLLPLGRHLVYSEGTVTEPHYIESVQKALGSSSGALGPKGTLVIVKNPGNKTLHTIGLIKYAEKDVKSRLNDGETIDCVWLFFDKDSFVDFDKACRRIEAITKDGKGSFNKDGLPADKNGVSWINCWSNECFELWVYLHYNYLDAPIHRGLYIKKINGFIKKKDKSLEYSKSIEDLLN